MNRDTLIGGGIFKDRETGEIVDVDAMHGAFIEMAELLEFIFNVENGLITLTVKDYTEMPRVVHITWGILKSEREKKRQQQREMMAHHGT